MNLGYRDPLYILAFDHRGTMLRRFGWTTLRNLEQHTTIVNAKHLIYQGFLRAVENGVPGGAAGVLVDEEYGSEVAALARAAGVPLAVCVEKSGQSVYDFAYADWPRRLDAIAPSFAKVLVRYNPDEGEVVRTRQCDRIRTLAAYLHATDTRLLLELVVPPLDWQMAKVGGDRRRFADEVRTDLVVRAIEQFQRDGVEADVWKVEGLADVEAFRAIAGAARAGDREDVGCVVLGAGAPVEEVNTWLAAAAEVDAFTGFAVGRSIWWDEVGAWHDGSMSRAEAVERVAANYTAMVDVFRRAKSPHVAASR